MEVKGTAVKSIPEFVKNEYNGGYNDWLNSLPEKSRKLMNDAIKATEWYPMEDAAIIPTEKIATQFFKNDYRKAAWECGRKSADYALTGIYKIYVKFGNPAHLLNRAGRIMAAYYQPAKLHTENQTKKSIDIVIAQFSSPSEIIENRIGGWLERALELSGAKTISINIEKSLTRDDHETRYKINWE